MAKSRRNTAIATLDRPLFYGGPDPITINRMETMVNNITSLQREKLNSVGRIDRRRDLDDECGYPKNELDATQYKDLIYREPAALIVNDFFPLESWKSQPRAFEDADTESETEWEAAVNNLPQMLNVEPSYYAGKVVNPINEFLLRADMLSGYGRYGVIVLDLADGKNWDEPVSPTKDMKLNAMWALPEHMATVNQFESGYAEEGDSKYRALARKRKGLPTQYSVSFSDPDDVSRQGLSEPNETKYVHWSRVIHLADFWHTASPSRIFARPRCSPSLNPILDIRKCRGASAEIYYKGGFGGHHIGTHPQLGPDVDVDRDEVKDAYEEFINSLQRVFVSSGMTVDSMAPDVTDPTQYILVQMQAIALQMRTPLRILLGNETGERATTEDRKRHNGNLHSRQHTYITPRIRIPFYDRLINLGVLPVPKNGYLDEWPDVSALSELERADVLLKRTQAYVAYTSGMESVVPPIDYMTKFDDLPEDEAQAILDNAADALDAEDTHTDPLGDADKALQREAMEQAAKQKPPVQNAELTGGKWVTIKGQHVYIKDGQIVAGGNKELKEEVNDKKSHNDEEETKNEIVSLHVKDSRALNDEAKSILASHASKSATTRDKLLRVSGKDEGHKQGDILDWSGEPKSFTASVDQVLSGGSAGKIAWKTSDQAGYLIEKPTKGIDVDYSKIKHPGFDVGKERETIVSGKYRVKEVRRIVEPGTFEAYGYKKTLYVLEEVESIKTNKSVTKTKKPKKSK